MLVKLINVYRVYCVQRLELEVLAYLFVRVFLVCVMLFEEMVYIGVKLVCLKLVVVIVFLLSVQAGRVFVGKFWGGLWGLRL